jgi:hypothetical protein
MEVAIAVQPTAGDRRFLRGEDGEKLPKSYISGESETVNRETSMETRWERRETLYVSGESETVKTGREYRDFTRPKTTVVCIL